MGRVPQDGDFLPDARVAELVGDDMGRPDVRDAVVRHATFFDSWEEVLPVIFGRDQSHTEIRDFRRRERIQSFRLNRARRPWI